MQGMSALSSSSLCSPVSTVDAQLSGANEQCSQVGDLIAQLADCLKPVLSPSHGKACGGTPGEVKALSQSPLADQLGGLTHTLERRADDLRDLIARLEI